jgi:hypothetical protein
MESLLNALSCLHFSQTLMHGTKNQQYSCFFLHLEFQTIETKNYFDWLQFHSFLTSTKTIHQSLAHVSHPLL